LEPGTELNYCTVFTEHGAFLLDADDPAFGKPSVVDSTVTNIGATDVSLVPAPVSVQEDGNVDYCQYVTQREYCLLRLLSSRFSCSLHGSIE
jgi:hypothetical protein